MHYYNLDIPDTQFIINYKINGEKIIVNLANGQQLLIDYNVDNEIKILDMMKSQVKDYDYIKNCINDTFLYHKKLFKFFSILTGMITGTIMIPLLVVVIVSKIYILLLFVIAVLVMGSYSVKELINMVKCSNDLADLEKCHYFLENEGLLKNVKIIDEAQKDLNVDNNLNSIENLFINKLISLKQELELMYKFKTNSGQEVEKVLRIGSKKGHNRFNK